MLTAKSLKRPNTDKEYKAEAIMTFLEGMIVRAEFIGVASGEDVYRRHAKLLAFPHSSLSQS
ncbi:hypothetical protein PEC302110_08460 [Pectobacterium araliae]|uniref:Uncharacterized protein n=1 Tax=Pectobacterium araliae TaxID=3073862 RepID=A0AAN0KL02_9GAMM|nr:hypothetical protein PEC302110_08460 [Pectobacterium sp. MAFF 302110]